MVKRIEWSDSAKNQLKNIYDYYALAAGKGVANKLVKRIMERTDILILHPYSGTKEELLLDYPEEYRYLVVNN